MNSTLISSIQRGNQREIVFTITDDRDRVHGPRLEFRPAAEQVNTFLADQVASASSSLRDDEISQNISEIVDRGRFAVPRLLYSTGAQNFAALRETYRIATRSGAVMIADYLGSLTDAQLRAAFSMTAGQVTTLRSEKLTPAAALADQVRASSGQ